MFATVFFLLAPVFARLLGQYVPGLLLMPPTFERLPTDVQLASLGALLLALALAWKQPKHGRPWLITAGLLGLQMVLFSTLGVLGKWEALVRLFAGFPAPILFSVGVAVGALVAWLGWDSIPQRRTRVEVLGAVDA